jgi:hypothetical protein
MFSSGKFQKDVQKCGQRKNARQRRLREEWKPLGVQKGSVSGGGVIIGEQAGSTPFLLTSKNN